MRKPQEPVIKAMANLSFADIAQAIAVSNSLSARAGVNLNTPAQAALTGAVWLEWAMAHGAVLPPELLEEINAQRS